MEVIIGYIITWFVPCVVLAAIAFCIVKKLWWALGVLVGSYALAMVLIHVLEQRTIGGLLAFFGPFLFFPIAIHMNSEGRDREKRRARIRRTRTRTGRASPERKRRG